MAASGHHRRGSSSHHRSTPTDNGSRKATPSSQQQEDDYVPGDPTAWLTPEEVAAQRRGEKVLSPMRLAPAVAAAAAPHPSSSPSSGPPSSGHESELAAVVLPHSNADPSSPVGPSGYDQFTENYPQHKAQALVETGFKAWTQSLRRTRWFPPAHWIRSYTRRRLLGDCSAGLTGAVMLVPQCLAYSALAGLPPVYGLYSSVIPVVIYSLFASSLTLSVGPVAPTCIMINNALAQLPISSQAEYIKLAVMLAFIGGLFQVALGLFRAGAISNLLSWPVKTGYMSAAALVILCSQLKSFFGLAMESDNSFFINLYRALAALPTTNPATIVLAILATILFVAVQHPKIPTWLPAPLFVIAGALLASAYIPLSQFGVAIIGNIPQGFPTPSVPFTSVSDAIAVAPGAAAVAFVSYVGSISLALSFSEDPLAIDANQELVAFGLASMIGSFFGSFMISGSFTRTAVNVQAGASSPISNLVSAAVILLVLMVLAPIFSWLPKAVLAALIVVASAQLIKVRDIRTIWRANRVDFIQGLLTFLSVLIFGMQVGIFLGVVISVFVLTMKTLYPRIQVLGRMPDRPDLFMDIKRFPDAQEHPQIKVMRIDSNLHFANVGRFVARLRRLLPHEYDADGEIDATEEARLHGHNPYLARDHAPAGTTQVRTQLLAVILDCCRVTDADCTACQQLAPVLKEYKSAGIKLLFASAPAPFRHHLKKFGIHDNALFHLTVQEAMSYVLHEHSETEA